MARDAKGLDESDRRLVEALRENSRLSMKDLGRRVCLTGQAVRNRVERLEDLGVLQRFTVNVNCPVFGYKVHALVKLKLACGHETFFRSLEQNTSLRVEHCYTTSGEYNVLLDVHFLDMESLQTFAAALKCPLVVEVVLKEHCARAD